VQCWWQRRRVIEGDAGQSSVQHSAVQRIAMSGYGLIVRVHKPKRAASRHLFCNCGTPQNGQRAALHCDFCTPSKAVVEGVVDMSRLLFRWGTSIESNAEKNLESYQTPQGRKCNGRMHGFCLRLCLIFLLEALSFTIMLVRNRQGPLPRGGILLF